MKKKYYAVVRSDAWKNKKRLSFPCVNAQLPIYWNKKVAMEMALWWGRGVEVIVIEL